MINITNCIKLYFELCKISLVLVRVAGSDQRRSRLSIARSRVLDFLVGDRINDGSVRDLKLTEIGNNAGD
jgi:hypothetical protein